MRFLFLHQWFSDQVLKAIGWTLIHSLWQGLLAAVLTGVIIVSTRKSRARLRYNLLGAVLILFVITTIITFSLEMPGGTTVTEKSFSKGTGLYTNDSFAINLSETSVTPKVTTIETLISYFNRNADLFVFIWIIFFLFNCLKLMAGLASIQRIKSYHIYKSPDEWLDKMQQLCNKLGIHQTVRLVQSGLIKVPVAVGFLKPVILLPLGLLSNLPPEQIETILLHELAHIRRKDYLINILQRFAEALFFFNPALLWISSLARQEREACCDDIVIANTDNKGNYLEALVSFQEYSLMTSGYAMAITSKRNFLLNRVKRMITSENKKLSSMEKILLTIGLVAIMAFTFVPQKEAAGKKSFIPVQKKDIPEQKIKEVSPEVMTVSNRKPVVKKENKKAVLETPGKTLLRDTVPSSKYRSNYDALTFPSTSSNINDDGKTKTETTSVTDQHGKVYSYTKLNDKITSFTIDGKVIPENEIGNYAELLAKIEAQLQENRRRKVESLHLKEIQLNQKLEQLKDHAIENARKDQLVAQKHLSSLLDEQNKRSRQLFDSQKKQLFNSQKRQSQAYEKSRRDMQRLLEKLKQQTKNVPMINGREVIKNDNHAENSVLAAAYFTTNINANINKDAAKSVDVKKEKTDVKAGHSLHLESKSGNVLNLQVDSRIQKDVLENFEYIPTVEEKLFQNERLNWDTRKSATPARKSQNIKPAQPNKPKVKVAPAGRRVIT